VSHETFFRVFCATKVLIATTPNVAYTSWTENEFWPISFQNVRMQLVTGPATTHNKSSQLQSMSGPRGFDKFWLSKRIRNGATNQARRWLFKSSPVVGCHYFPPGLQSSSQPKNVTVFRPSYTALWHRHITKLVAPVSMRYLVRTCQHTRPWYDIRIRLFWHCWEAPQRTHACG